MKSHPAAPTTSTKATLAPELMGTGCAERTTTSAGPQVTVASNGVPASYTKSANSEYLPADKSPKSAKSSQNRTPAAGPDSVAFRITRISLPAATASSTKGVLVVDHGPQTRAVTGESVSAGEGSSSPKKPRQPANGAESAGIAARTAIKSSAEAIAPRLLIQSASRFSSRRSKHSLCSPRRQRSPIPNRILTASGHDLGRRCDDDSASSGSGSSGALPDSTRSTSRDLRQTLRAGRRRRARTVPSIDWMLSSRPAGRSPSRSATA